MKYLPVVLLITALGFAQDKPSTAPKLKPEVALAISQAEGKLKDIQLQEDQIIQQYESLEKQKPPAAQAVEALRASALKDSGIDPTKFTLNGLEVAPKPAAK